jgi:ABC-2 type transport system ATP-binding protein
MIENKGYILELQDVTKKFPKSQFCLEKVSFALPKGAIMGFVGENGAGKTTTIGCILNTLKKDNGTIKLFGKELSDNDIDIKEQIGVVYDASNFSGSLTPNNLSDIMQGIYKQWNNKIYKNYLDAFKLPLKQKISTFSKGMTMKLAIAVAIAHSPKLLVLDEATSGLDPVVRDDILEVFLEFVQDDSRSILLSSHITSDLEKVADYITFIHNGKILLSTSKDELMYKYGVLQCKSSQFEQVNKKDILAYRKRDYQIDVLVNDIDVMRRKYPSFITDKVGIDDILLMLVRGGQV